MPVRALSGDEPLESGDGEETGNDPLRGTNDERPRCQRPLLLDDHGFVRTGADAAITDGLDAEL